MRVVQLGEIPRHEIPQEFLLGIIVIPRPLVDGVVVVFQPVHQDRHGNGSYMAPLVRIAGPGRILVLVPDALHPLHGRPQVLALDPVVPAILGGKAADVIARGFDKPPLSHQAGGVRLVGMLSTMKCAL